MTADGDVETVVTEWLITRDTDKYQQVFEYLLSRYRDSVVAGTMWEIGIKSELCS